LSLRIFIHLDSDWFAHAIVPSCQSIGGTTSKIEPLEQGEIIVPADGIVIVSSLMGKADASTLSNFLNKGRTFERLSISVEMGDRRFMG